MGPRSPGSKVIIFHISSDFPPLSSAASWTGNAHEMGWVVAISNFVTDWTPDAQSDVRRQTPLTFKWGNAKKTSAVIPTFRLLIDVLE